MEQTFTIQTQSPDETMDLSSRLGTLLQEGDVLTLEGDLGAGKTTFTKGLAKGLDVKRTVNSPTFTIVKEYKGRLPLYHMDVYRLEDSDEDIGFDEYFYGNGVSVIEWAHFIEEFLPSNRLDIRLSYLEGDMRSIKLMPKGDHYIRVCEELVK
ncbi:tRNA (adenosine(37)-N6)-threonylcarbamoyltransferase complex ATPase subunit type 1 TsaE [Pontibacillus sp. HMF3514]|uniref:tRNA (adenosine(37)-N6)-threonylcarbamoyltransferase complex ATPase subunit type 1 TsaE n=1 Tax=Pontibacillus sp. HMF3514 TaxID=2692425 RepID=UPI00131F7CDC|nr:tRNA (adenosine(37)-N6)-threonylcarbamoyltransferase complex ATPase subunit type 1 TsaE [Pontibacillus sp. HMF3514]QHE54177.1 tRNA (adenosine(37)-N6)-threonylcarbamoyltransferase complex ATPase subunit type 1 TsaE [Pontibacillus sp. HMF3514]